MAKGSITVDEVRCKGCGLCVDFCPKDVIELDAQKLNAKGYHPATPARPEDCIGCAICATMCPDVAITVDKEDN